MTAQKSTPDATGAPLIYGHRGASGTHPENTIAAFEAAVAMGVAGVELDVRRTADGGVVVHHDADLADGRDIFDLRTDELPDEVPTLAAVLEVCADITVNIEIKSDRGDRDYDPAYPISGLVVDVVDAAAARDRVIVTSFDFDAVDILRRDGIDIPTGYIAMVAPPWDRIVEFGHNAYMPWVAIATPELVGRAHEHGLFVGTWTANDEAVIQTVAEAGVDAILTDFPERAEEILGRA